MALGGYDRILSDIGIVSELIIENNQGIFKERIL